MRFLVLTVPLLLSLAGCGWSIDSARESAAEATCDSYERCDQLGDKKVYASYNECMTRERAVWLDRWPTSDCEGHENGDAVDTCLKAIENISCNSVLDFLATLDKCGKKNVCSE